MNRRTKMLVLTRKVGESIIIDNTIDVKVLSIQRGQISLGIEAPKNISVHREEISKKIVDAVVNIR